jgi:Flp pilus assembly protein TadG
MPRPRDGHRRARVRGSLARVSRRGHWHDDGGQVAGIEGLIFGVLIFVLGSFLVINLWAVIDARLAADVGAREAARAFVEGRNLGDAKDQAIAAAQEAMEGYGRPIPDTAVSFSPDNVFERCARVTITVTYQLPGVLTPVFGSFGQGVTVYGRHTELVDPLRNNVGSSDQELGLCG